MKKFILLVFATLGLFGQGFVPPFDPQAQAAFDKAYWTSQPSEVQALRGLPSDQAPTQALALASKGFIIDYSIQAMSWDPYAVMVLRQNDGLTWTASALQPNICLTIPGANNPPFCPYDPSKPPQGSIKTSTDPKDYPPFVVPVPPQPVPTPVKGLVGAFNGAVYVPGPLAMKNGVPQVADGQKVVQDGVGYTAHVYKWPFGQGVFFSKP